MNLKDRQEGWNGRRVWLIAKKPAVHQRIVIELGGSAPRVVEDIPSLQCDACGMVVADGETCVAVTMYRAENPIGLWEHEYGTVIPEEQVQVTDALEKVAK
jgi:YgiT-type zinc finger domain-containing protein